MKKLLLTGFAGYTVVNDGKKGYVTDAEGNKLKVTKGEVSLIASEDIKDAEGTVTINKGDKVAYKMTDLMNTDAKFWTEDAPVASTEPDTRTPEQIAADAAEQAHKDKLKELRGAVTAAQKALISATNEELLAKKGEYDVAEKALADYIAENKEKVSPEEEAAQLAYDEAYAEAEGFRDLFLGAKEVLDAAITELKKHKKNGVKGLQAAGAAAGDRTQKLSYNIAQEIRRHYAMGRPADVNPTGQPLPEGRTEPYTVVELAEMFGCTTNVIMYNVYYTQHKLKKGDTAYTPLVNRYYPALGETTNETGTDGAPYLEDGIVETPERYKLPENRKAPAVKKADAPAVEA